MPVYSVSRCHLLIAVVLCSGLLLSDALSLSSNNLNESPTTPSSRREVLMGGGRGAAAAAVVTSIISSSRLPSWANAQVVPEDTVVDMAKINAARSSTTLTTTTITTPNGRPPINIAPMADPPPNIIVRTSNVMTTSIPRIGYSFYKTPPDQAERCTRLALRAGIRHLDVATDYGSNSQIAKALAPYLNVGMTGLDFSNESIEVLDQLDATKLAGEQHASVTLGGTESNQQRAKLQLAPAPVGSSGRRGRREALFIHHKISNQEQSTDPVIVRRSVKQAIAELGCLYLDMVSIHSPLTDKASRLITYQALLDLRESGFIKSVGVCNYGIAPLQEIVAAGLELPVVNQLELSPFNTHPEVVDWCNQNGVAVSCSAWSRLSSADGPTQGWDVLAKLAQLKGMTKAQVLVRWALQKGYICVPRSNAASKVERIAIAENSYGGINNPQTTSPPSSSSSSSFLLTREEIQLLDSLNVSYPAGKLGRRDGWTDRDVTGPDWDPTNVP